MYDVRCKMEDVVRCMMYVDVRCKREDARCKYGCSLPQKCKQKGKFTPRISYRLNLYVFSCILKNLCNFAAEKTILAKGKSKCGFLGSEGFRFQTVITALALRTFMQEHGGIEGFVVFCFGHNGEGDMR